jgi:hypothetical protein
LVALAICTARLGKYSIQAMTDPQPLTEQPHNRATDGGWLCWIALRMSELWNFIDARDLDKHAVSVVILLGTMKVTEWAMAFAGAHPDKSGVEVAAIIASVLVPYNALQAAAIAWYFKARQ